MRRNFVYFGVDAAATMAFDNHAAQTLQLTTGGFDNPVPTGTNFIKNGGLKVTVTGHAEHTFGTYYGVTTGEVEIHPNALTYDGTDTITIATAAADPVYGWTKSGTANNNDLDVTQLKPYVEGNGYMYASDNLHWSGAAGATTTRLAYKAKTGDTVLGIGSGIDTITVTHGSAKHKEFWQEYTDVVAGSDKVKGMVVVVDDMRDLQLTAENASGIASVTASYDS